MRNLFVVLGDQLDAASQALAELDPRRDAVLMMEVDEEATYVKQHKHRLVLFFAAMRHFRDALRDAGWTVHYTEVDDRLNRGSFARELPRWIGKLRPSAVRVRQPGDHRVLRSLEEACASRKVPLEVVEDDHFLCPLDAFREWRAGRKVIVLEHFYRWMRRREDILMEGSKPETGRWNYDADNRSPWKKGTSIPTLPVHRYDALTKQVMTMVDARYADHPGETSTFSLPVTRAQALRDLEAFLTERLPTFGVYQDAMPEGEPFVFHSRLSSALNLHLLSAREVVGGALAAYRDGGAPIAAVEGFVRQVLGWRELVRGIYWVEMPAYAGLNALDARVPVPDVFWTGETEMRCVADAMKNVLTHGYAHHIQRLMVLGLYGLLLGVDPYALHEWHMALYADAIDWVSLPNVLGMSQYADGGIVGTKPYAATGKYIKRMSTYCKTCRFRPEQRVGDDACPMTTLYWDFLLRNRKRLAGNTRMRMQLKNVERLKDAEAKAIRAHARKLRQPSGASGLA
ncbi:MAG: cryptochrome/photolyase family protein [Myxococcota bacterium]